MLKIHIKILLVVVTAIAILLVAGLVFLRSIFTPALSQKATEKDFVKNQDIILLVANYLINSTYNTIGLSHTDDGKTMYASGYGYVDIENLQVIEAINTLFKDSGYKSIDKHLNTIKFLRSSPTMDFGSGVMYFIDESEQQLQMITKLEPLPEQNWYYYEENYNEWKKQNE